VLVLSTSNGTKALTAAAPCGRVYIASFANLRAAGRVLAEDLKAGRGKTLLIACSGREGGFCEEDTVAAGFLLAHVRERLGRAEVEYSDTAKASLRTAEGADRDFPRLLRESFWGRHLTTLGMAEDIAFCGRLDWTEAVPRLEGGAIVAG
jgi:2-phosphosulfolactate phosphatase